jgi:hypothetical protein
MPLDVAEGAEERLTEVLGLRKEAVVGGVLARVIPNSFRGVEFRPVRWQLEHLHVAAVLGEPVIGFLLFVVRGVVLNQEHTLTPPIKRGNQNLIQERHVGFPLEIVLLMEVDELGGVHPHRPKDLLRVALAPGGDVWLAGHARPSGMQGRRLAKRRLVRKNNYRPFAPGFFLRRGWV